jgi:hypothetical protein
MDLKTDLPGVYRHESGALINKNNSALMDYKRKRQDTNKLNSIELRINSLTEEVNRLKKIIENMSNNSKV